jgi:hypothetical protein
MVPFYWDSRYYSVSHIIATFKVQVDKQKEEQLVNQNMGKKCGFLAQRILKVFKSKFLKSNFRIKSTFLGHKKEI